MRLAFLLFLFALTLLFAGAARSDEESITLTPAQVEELKAQIRQWVGQAYTAGQADAKARCASLI